MVMMDGVVEGVVGWWEWDGWWVVVGCGGWCLDIVLLRASLLRLLLLLPSPRSMASNTHIILSQLPCTYVQIVPADLCPGGWGGWVGGSPTHYKQVSVVRRRGGRLVPLDGAGAGGGRGADATSPLL